jgi:hypothetical protein
MTRRPTLFTGLLMATCWLAACIPALVPPQLAHTPGPPVIVANSTYRAVDFTVDYPAGWLAISSAATDPPAAIFIAPDQHALVIIGQGVTDAPPLAVPGPTRTDRRQAITVAGVPVTLILRALSDDFAAAEPLFARMAQSVR